MKTAVLVVLAIIAAMTLPNLIAPDPAFPQEVEISE